MNVSQRKANGNTWGRATSWGRTLFIVVAFLIFQYIADSLPGLGLS